jgi:hypothetical protein
MNARFREEPALPGERAAHPDDTPPEYWRAFSIVAFTMNRFLVDHVLRSSRPFDNDIEAMILFGTLSHLNVAHLLPPGASPSRQLGPNGSVPDAQPQLRPVRLRDLVQITGRPRETVRRKLDKLHADGWIKRVVDGWVLDIGSVSQEMRAHTLDGARRFLEAAAVMSAALKDAERILAEDGNGAASPGRAAQR